MIAPRTTWALDVQSPPQPSGWLTELNAVHGPGIRATLRRILGNADDAQDAYQDCLHHLARRRTGDAIGSARRYAYRTATNLAIETIRRRERHGAHWKHIVANERSKAPGTAAAQHVSNSPGWACGDLWQAVARLPRHLHNVIVLHDLAGLPYKEIAGILGIQPTTARVYRRQAVVKLGDMLSQDRKAVGSH